MNDNKYIHHLLLADDQLIVTEDEVYTTLMFLDVRDAYYECRLNINMRKIELLASSLKVDILLGNINIKIVEKFEYL